MPESEENERSVAVKLLYTYHDTRNQRFIAKPYGTLPVRVDTESGLGIIALGPCLDAILASSPELAAAIEEYSVYSVDYSEPELPLQGHGKLSTVHDWAIKAPKEHQVIGRMTKAAFNADILEVQFHFSRLAPRSSPMGLGIHHPSMHHPGILSGLSTGFASGPPSMPSSGPSHVQPNGSQSGLSNGSQGMPNLHTSPLHSLNQNHLGTPLQSHHMPPGHPHGLSDGPVHSAHNIPLPSSPPVPMSSLSSSASQKRRPKMSLCMEDLDQIPAKRAAAAPEPRSDPSPTEKSVLFSDQSNEPAKRPARPSTRESKRAASTPVQENDVQSAPKRRRRDKIAAKMYAKICNGEAPPYCVNCGAVETSAWRFMEVQDPVDLQTRDVMMCNACGLYYRSKKSMRPKELWEWPRLRNSQNMTAVVAAASAAHEAARVRMFTGVPRSMEQPMLDSSAGPISDPLTDPVNESVPGSVADTVTDCASDPVTEAASDAANVTDHGTATVTEGTDPITDATEDTSTDPLVPSTPRNNKENMPPNGTPGTLDKLFWGDDGNGQLHKTPSPSGTNSAWLMRFINADHTLSPSPYRKNTREMLGPAPDSPISSSPPRQDLDVWSDWSMLPTSPILAVKKRTI